VPAAADRQTADGQTSAVPKHFTRPARLRAQPPEALTTRDQARWDAKEKRAMVPGMTERERLAADVRLCMWLADATLGPTRTSVSPTATTSAHRSPLFSRVGWDGLAMARVMGRWMRLKQPVLERKQPGRNAVSIH
jgi:hypothetical protein